MKQAETRHIGGGRESEQAFIRKCKNHARFLRRSTRAHIPEASTDALVWGGLACSSGASPVIGPERGGRGRYHVFATTGDGTMSSNMNNLAFTSYGGFVW
jgi:glycine/D-amino acid oxidase-like deaminating enzyme